MNQRIELSDGQEAHWLGGYGMLYVHRGEKRLYFPADLMAEAISAAEKWIASGCPEMGRA